MYRAVVHGEAVKHLLACTARERRLLLRFLEQLESDPCYGLNCQARRSY